MSFEIMDKGAYLWVLKEKQKTWFSSVTISFRNPKLKPVEPRVSIFLENKVFSLTSRDRPKSAPYPRLKNSKRTSKCQLTVLENRKAKKWTEWRAGAR